jgi:hypothetical protein
MALALAGNVQRQSGYWNTCSDWLVLFGERSGGGVLLRNDPNGNARLADIVITEYSNSAPQSQQT